MNIFQYKRQEFLRAVYDTVGGGGRFRLKVGPFSRSVELQAIDAVKGDRQAADRMEWFLGTVARLSWAFPVHPHVVVTRMDRNKIGFWVADEKHSVFW